ncbi:hypothetical protein [uncultured Thiohalocapsa sp.]|uniref:hypothetical protein n=1 Tax=uncultured Thiohalocapsa sp. TaxID=768990 RepID=UPI0025F2BDA3|nr:hypothetical protein [uncultured Thiohalocapsa sp.]
MAYAPRLSAPALLGAAVALPAVAGQTPAERIELLEAKVRVLTERVTALEADRGDTAASEPGGIAWVLGDDLRGRPFRIAHKALDLDDGRVELLLQITEPVQATERWMLGGPAPIRLILRAADGSERHLYMTLLRGASFEPGRHLHLLAEMDPALAAATSQIVVEHAD